MYIRSDVDLEELLFSLPSMPVTELENLICLCDTPIFSRLYLQPLVRIVDDTCLTLLALRDIQVNPAHRGSGHFKKVFNVLNQLPVPVLFDDVVNPRLGEYLEANGYKSLYTEKAGYSIKSYYRLPQNK